MRRESGVLAVGEMARYMAHGYKVPRIKAASDGQYGLLTYLALS